MSEIYQSSVDILYDGDKHFWGERCQLDVFIALHNKSHCLEIIIYDPVAKIEYPGLYMNFTTCKSKLDVEEYNRLIMKKTKQYESRNRKVPMKVIEYEVYCDLIPKYIMSNMDVKPKAGFPGCFNVYLFERLIGSNMPMHLLREQPSDLQPTVIDRTRRTVEESSARYKHLGQRKRNELLEKEFLKAAGVSAIVAAPKLSPLEAKNQKYLTRPRRRWKRAIKRVIFLMQVERYDAIIRRSKIGAWYSSLKNRSTAKHLKVLRNVTKKLINVRRISVAGTDSDHFPDAHLPQLQPRSPMSEAASRRLSHRRRSHGTLTPPSSNYQPSRGSDFRESHSLPSALNLSPHQQSLLLDREGGSKKTGVSWLEKKSNESLRKTNKSLSPTRAIKNDKFFKEENEKMRSLSPMQRFGMELAPISTTTDEGKSMDSDGVASPTRRGSSFGVKASPVSRNGVPMSPMQSCSSRRNSHANNVLISGFANEMSKLDQNVSIQKFAKY